MLIKMEPTKSTNENKRVEFQSLMKVLISMIAEIGNFIKKMGKIEQKYPEEYKIMQEFSPEFLNKLVDETPPEIAGLFLKISLRLASLGPRLSDFMKLPADEKIKLGKEIDDLVKDLTTLLDKALKEKS